MKSPLTATILLRGNIRQDSFGRIVIDECPSDPQHLEFSLTDPEHNRPKCRSLVEEIFLPFLGRRGYLMVNVSFVEMNTDPNGTQLEDPQPFVDSLGG